MGYSVPSKREVVITDIVSPGPKAIHGLDDFSPDHKYHEFEVARIYNMSAGRIVYLGDWHSHPNGSVYLSEKDRATLQRIGSSQEARMPTPLMAIMAGGLTAGWRLGVFQGHLSRRWLWPSLTASECDIIQFDPNTV